MSWIFVLAAVGTLLKLAGGSVAIEWVANELLHSPPSHPLLMAAAVRGVSAGVSAAGTMAVFSVVPADLFISHGLPLLFGVDVLSSLAGLWLAVGLVYRTRPLHTAAIGFVLLLVLTTVSLFPLVHLGLIAWRAIAAWRKRRLKLLSEAVE